MNSSMTYCVMPTRESFRLCLDQSNGRTFRDITKLYQWCLYKWSFAKLFYI